MDKKRIPVNSLGIKIKEEREKLNLTEEELSWKINNKKIDKKKIKKWEKGIEFPNLDEIYILASYLNLNPNELLNIRNQIQEESQVEPNWFFRHLFGKFFKIGKPGFKFVFEIILGACVIFLAANFKKFEDMMGSDSSGVQEQLVIDIIKNETEKYTKSNYEEKNELYEEESSNKLTNNTLTSNNVASNEVVNKTANN